MRLKKFERTNNQAVVVQDITSFPQFSSSKAPFVYILEKRKWQDNIMTTRLKNHSNLIALLAYIEILVFLSICIQVQSCFLPQAGNHDIRLQKKQRYHN